MKYVMMYERCNQKEWAIYVLCDDIYRVKYCQGDWYDKETYEMRDMFDPKDGDKYLTEEELQTFLLEHL